MAELLYSDSVPGTQRTYQVDMSFSQQILKVQIVPQNELLSWDITGKIQPTVFFGRVNYPVCGEYLSITTVGIYIAKYTNYSLRIYQPPTVAGYNLEISSVDYESFFLNDITTNNLVTTNPNYSSFGVAPDSFTILAANANRINGGVIINNTALAILWVWPGDGTAYPTLPGVPVLPNGGTYVLPIGYRGAVQGIWDNGEAAGGGAAIEFSL
jgi:hypothetical protein